MTLEDTGRFPQAAAACIGSSIEQGCETRLVSSILLALLLSGCSSVPLKPPPLPPSSTASENPVIRTSKAMLGVPYRRGGDSPGEGFDCSGFVRYVYLRVGVQLPRTANEQYNYLTSVGPQKMLPGDLLFFLLPRAENLHVGLYIGGRRFIHAPSPGKRVSYADLSNPFWGRRLVDARRVGKAQQVAVSRVAPPTDVGTPSLNLSFQNNLTARRP